MPARNLFFFFLPLLLVFGYGLKRSWSAPTGDFAVYYGGSREIVHGRYPDAYDLRRLNAAIIADGYSGVFVSYVPNPPTSAFLCAPLLLLPMGVSKIVFNIFSCGIFLLTLW